MEKVSNASPTDWYTPPHDTPIYTCVRPPFYYKHFIWPKIRTLGHSLFETSFTRKLCLHELETIVALREVATGHCSTSSDFMFCYASLTKHIDSRLEWFLEKKWIPENLGLIWLEISQAFLIEVSFTLYFASRGLVLKFVLRLHEFCCCCFFFSRWRL